MPHAKSETLYVYLKKKNKTGKKKMGHRTTRKSKDEKEMIMQIYTDSMINMGIKINVSSYLSLDIHICCCM